MENKLRIAVICGGVSNEKETSLDSGRNIVYKLSQEKYEIIPLFLNKDLELYKLNQRLLVKNSTKDIEAALGHAVQQNEIVRIAWDELPAQCDFVFIGLHGGVGENGTIQGALEMLKLPYNGSGIFTSGLCAQKYQTTKYLQSKGFDALSCMLITREEWGSQKTELLQRIALEVAYPVISKPNDDGCSVMVYKSKTEAELIEHIEKTLERKKEVLVEQCAPGIELTVGVIGNDIVKALVPTQTVAVKGVLSMEEKFLPGAGQNITPAQLPDEDLKFVQKVIERAYSALGCSGYSRFDCFYDQGKVYIIDVNTLPALTPATCIFHQAAELDIAPSEFLDIIIKLGLEKHAKDAQVYAHIFTHTVPVENLCN